jgi:hypothetical protein
VLPVLQVAHSRPVPGDYLSMSIGLNLADLGIDANTASVTPAAPTRSVKPEPVYAPFDSAKPSQLVEGSVLAKTLYNVWSGAPVTIVNSPPGAGKTTLIVDLIAQLADRGREMTISVIAPTRRGTIDVASRVQARLDEMGAEVLVDLSMAKMTTDEEDFASPTLLLAQAAISAAISRAKVALTGGHTPSDADSRTLNGPVITTMAAMARRAGLIEEECLYRSYDTTNADARHIDHHSNAPICDVMIIDEAYQMTFADVLTASSFARQFVFVGDPGQIGPVVTSNMSAYDGVTRPPHSRAPEVFAGYEDAQVMALPYTYRLGATTAKAIAPLYSFPFASRRPDRVLTGRDGLQFKELESIEVPEIDSPADIPTLRMVTNRARSFVGSVVTETAGDAESFHEVRPRDIAIVVAHNAQKVALETLLEGTNGEGIHVGTADSLQGGQWHAVVALDPLVGKFTAGSHQLSLGRLCVMASRHMTHLTWVFASNWAEVLETAGEESEDAITGAKVRRSLIAG